MKQISYLPSIENRVQSLTNRFMAIGLNKEQSLAAAKLSIDLMFEFMEEDDKIYETTYWENSIWTNYFTNIKNELQKNYENLQATSVIGTC